jgi:glutamyl-Q tRNA(Asp) synthetase
LRRAGQTFECGCSRRLRHADEERGYPGTCRDKAPRRPPTATRFRIDERQSVRIEDRFQGECCFELRTLGDVVIRRRDGIVAYQLAVVVDDAEQGVNYVVRGADLLTSTAWQMSLQAALRLPRPSYAHLPLVVEPDGSKLAKSARSLPLQAQRAAPLLVTALRLLGQTAPPQVRLEFEAPEALLAWGIRHWNPAAIRGMRAVPAPAPCRASAGIECF